jgi:Sortilin, neurotensin receptor 3, C-terminal
VDCYVGERYKDPVEHEDNCPCTAEDYEWWVYLWSTSTLTFMLIYYLVHRCSDYNFVRNDKECVPVGPEPIPAGVCNGDPNQMYKGSSGFRKIPGNTCTGGVKMDEKVDKKCSQGGFFWFARCLWWNGMLMGFGFGSSTQGGGCHSSDCELGF